SLGYALCALWRSFGVEPDLLAGHSIGEVLAAQVAGILSLEDAVRLVGARARLMQALPADGAMAAIADSADEVSAVLGSLDRAPEIAAVNGPESVVISGEERDVERVVGTFTARGVGARRLAVSHAFHSRLMEPMQEALRREIASIDFRAPARPLASNLGGGLTGDEVRSPEYWVAQARSCVRFAANVEALYAAGAETFIELGPRPTLLGLVAAVRPDARPTLLPSLRADRPETRTLVESLSAWYADGGALDWKGVL